MKIRSKSGQVGSDQIRSSSVILCQDQIISGQDHVRSGNVKSCVLRSRSSPVSSVQIRSNQVRSDHARSCQLRSDQVNDKSRRSCQISIGQVRSGPVSSRSGQVRS